MTPNPPPPASGQVPPQGPDEAPVGADGIAGLAARLAVLVPGVVRLQPGLRQAVGRAARLLFIPGAMPDERAATDGIDVQLAPEVKVVLRIVTGVDPSPWSTARDVQQQVGAELGRRLGEPVTVVVVVVDVDTDG